MVLGGESLGIKFTLTETLDRLGITRNKLAVESKIRPATIADLVHGQTKRIELGTLVSLLDTLNLLVEDKGINVTIEDIIKYEQK